MPGVSRHGRILLFTLLCAVRLSRSACRAVCPCYQDSVNFVFVCPKSASEWMNQAIPKILLMLIPNPHPPKKRTKTSLRASKNKSLRTSQDPTPLDPSPSTTSM
nr:placenta-specific gene 8 protein-like [Biomphalaria glabrata]